MRDEDANPALDGKQMRRQWNMYMGEKEKKKRSSRSSRTRCADVTLSVLLNMKEEWGETRRQTQTGAPPKTQNRQAAASENSFHLYIYIYVCVCVLEERKKEEEGSSLGMGYT